MEPMHRLGVAFVLAVAIAGIAAPASDPITQAASRLVEGLPAHRLAEARFAFDDEEREDVRYAPFLLDGVEQGELSDADARRVDELLAASLSARGFEIVRSIRLLEEAVRHKEEQRFGWLYLWGGSRDPGRYFLALFGEPRDDAPWAYRYDGHHVSLNVTLVPGHVPSTSPLFLGAEPRRVPEGSPHAGLRVLGEEEDLARALWASLDATQRARAGLSYRDDRGHMLGQVRRVEPDDPVGLPRGEMDPHQRALLDALVERFAGHWREDIAVARRGEIERSGRDAIHFSWTEADTPEGAFYVRIQGPTLLIEIDNTSDADHVHAVWHGYGTDFGDDLLASHYRREHGVALARLR
jgi:hypothetical protein